MIKFKVGDKVYSKEYKKYGKIECIHPDNRYYPIIVRFSYPNFMNNISYTPDGRRYSDAKPTLIIPIEEKINKLLSLF